MCKTRELDAYECVHTNYDDFKDEIISMDRASLWTPAVKSSGLRTENIDLPMYINELVAKDPSLNYDAVYDTSTTGTKLLLKFNDKVRPVRDTAFKTLLETAKIQGSALGKVDTVSLSTIINLCLKVASGHSLILERDGKVNAVLSDAQYQIMPIPELLSITETALTKFGNVRFINAFTRHDIVSGVWELPDAQSELVEQYRKAINRLSLSPVYGSNFMPCVRFSSSDTGSCAATLMPLYRLSGGGYVRINDGIKVEHKKRTGKTGTELFETAADELYACFTDFEKSIGEMANTVIENPLNVIVGLCKKTGIPKKLGSCAYDEFETLCGNNPCTMYDVYVAMSKCSYYAQTLGYTDSKVLAVEEQVAKILRYNWTDFDLPGIVSWS